MDLHKLKIADVRGLEAAKLRETEVEIRRELVKIRMDIYTARSAHGAKVRGLRRALARVMTVKSALGKSAPKAAKAAKVAAPKAPKASKPAKAAGPKTAAAKPTKAKASKK